MTLLKFRLFPAVLLSILSLHSQSQEPTQTEENTKALASWSFEKSDSLEIHGNYRYVKGIQGDAIKFDGFTTSLMVEPEDAPETGSEFSVEAWITLGAYPWNIVPVVAQENKAITGYFFAGS